MGNIPIANAQGKQIPRAYSDEDAKRFHPINSAYMLALDNFRHNNMRKAAERLAAYADVFHRLHHVFVDISEGERHARGGSDPFWTEPIAHAAELMGKAVDCMGAAIASAVNMTAYDEQEDPLRKLANLPDLVLTHEGYRNLIVQFTDQDLARAHENGQEERDHATLETMTAMRDRYAVMMQRFQVFFSDICDLGEGENAGFYAVDDLAAYRLWRIAWELEKGLHSYHHSIVCNIGSMTAMKPPEVAPTGDSNADH